MSNGSAGWEGPNVYAKPPFGGPRQGLKYLARYTHRVAISNQRLTSLANGRVTFRWKNYAGGNQLAIMTLRAEEFMRRFLLHVLPSGFVKVRHFGLLANRGRRESLALCRELLAASSPARDLHPTRDRLTNHVETDQRDRCPRCRAGHMHRFETLLPQPFPTSLLHPAIRRHPSPMDTS